MRSLLSFPERKLVHYYKHLNKKECLSDLSVGQGKEEKMKERQKGKTHLDSACSFRS